MPKGKCNYNNINEAMYGCLVSIFGKKKKRIWWIKERIRIVLLHKVFSKSL